jgi:hypothetical protein
MAQVVKVEGESVVYLCRNGCRNHFVVNGKNLTSVTNVMTVFKSSQPTPIQMVKWTSFNLIVLYQDTKLIDIVSVKRMLEAFKRLVNVSDKVDLRQLEKVIAKKFKSNHHCMAGLMPLSSQPLNLPIEGHILSMEVLNSSFISRNHNLE